MFLVLTAFNRFEHLLKASKRNPFSMMKNNRMSDNDRKSVRSYDCIKMLFFTLTRCYSFSGRVGNSDQIIRLDDFGFLNGGEAIFSFHSSNLSGVKFVLHPKEFEFMISRIDFRQVCEDKIMLHNCYSLNSSRNIDNLYTVFNESSIIIPIIINCERKNVVFNGKMQNPNTYLDSRQISIPYIYIGYGIIYVFLGYQWIKNTIQNQYYLIALQDGFVISTLLQSISLFIFSLYWMKRSRSSDFFVEYYFTLFDILPIALLLIFNIAAIKGLGTIVERFSNLDWLEIIPNMILFAISVKIKDIIKPPILAAVNVLAFCVSSGKIISVYIIQFFNINKREEIVGRLPDDHISKKQIQHIHKFLYAILAFLLFFFTLLFII